MIIESKADNYVATVKNNGGEVVLYWEMGKYHISVDLPELLQSGIDLNQMILQMILHLAKGNEPL